jgi:hypothetical protein
MAERGGYGWARYGVVTGKYRVVHWKIRQLLTNTQLALQDSQQSYECVVYRSSSPVSAPIYRNQGYISKVRLTICNGVPAHAHNRDHFSSGQRAQRRRQPHLRLRGPTIPPLQSPAQFAAEQTLSTMQQEP